MQSSNIKASVFPNDIRNMNCIICRSSSHKTLACPMASRYEAVELFKIYKKVEVCVNCLQYGHDAYVCNRNPSCAICKGYHTTHVHSLYQEIEKANKNNRGANGANKSPNS